MRRYLTGAAFVLLCSCGGGGDDNTNGFADDVRRVDDARDTSGSDDGSDDTSTQDTTIGDTTIEDVADEPELTPRNLPDVDAANDAFVQAFCDCRADELFFGNDSLCRSTAEDQLVYMRDNPGLSACVDGVVRPYGDAGFDLMDCLNTALVTGGDCYASCPTDDPDGICGGLIESGVADCENSPTAPAGMLDAIEATCQQ